MASVTVTVTDDAPEYAGYYYWQYHLTNLSFASGIGSFAVPVEDASTVWDASCFVLAGGWDTSYEPFPGNSDVIWYQGNPIGIGESGDFWFVTHPTAVGLTNGLVDNGTFTDPNTSPAGFVAAPIPPGHGLPGAPLPAILVAARDDSDDSNNGLTTLREAIRWVNEQNLPAQQLQVRFTTGMNFASIDLLSQLPTVTKNIFINGSGRNITVQRSAPLGDFRLIQGTDVSKIQIAGLTLQNGYLPNPGANGGAILAAGDLTLQDCTVRDNVASKGAGVYCGGDLIVEDCVIRDNQAGDSGGGVYAAGSLTLSGGVIRDNRASTNGGGIYAGSDMVHIQNTFVYLNKVGLLVPLAGTGWGGGIYIGPNVIQAVIAGSEVFDNTADGPGGGIYVAGGAAGGPVTDVTISNSWVYGNEAQKGGGVATGTGSSILRLKEDTTLAYNWAAEKGGGVYLGGGTLVTSFVTITENYAPLGGGLYGVTGTFWEGIGGAAIFNNSLDDVNGGAA